MLLYGIAHGMAFLHSKKIVHRNLKPGNILIDDNLLPIICDFGFCIKEDILLDESTPEQVGTPLYMAPEIHQDMKYTKSVDILSFSFIAYEIITGKKLFDRMSLFQMINKKIQGERPKMDKSVPDTYQNLIKRCWDGEPEKRPSFEEIVMPLKTDKGFRTDLIDENEFLDFIESINEQTDEKDIKK